MLTELNWGRVDTGWEGWAAAVGRGGWWAPEERWGEHTSRDPEPHSQPWPAFRGTQAQLPGSQVKAPALHTNSSSILPWFRWTHAFLESKGMYQTHIFFFFLRANKMSRSTELCYNRQGSQRFQTRSWQAYLCDIQSSYLLFIYFHKTVALNLACFPQGSTDPSQHPVHLL